MLVLTRMLICKHQACNNMYSIRNQRLHIIALIHGRIHVSTHNYKTILVLEIRRGTTRSRMRIYARSYEGELRHLCGGRASRQCNTVRWDEVHVWQRTVLLAYYALHQSWCIAYRQQRQGRIESKHENKRYTLATFHLSFADQNSFAAAVQAMASNVKRCQLNKRMCDAISLIGLQRVDRVDYRLKNVSMVIGRFKRPLLGLIRDWNFVFLGGGFREPSDTE